jgi:tetrapyrrole methylase family protein/MazG family protein
MSDAFSRLKDLVAYLRSEKGCAWDREQTADTLKPHVLEEAHEVCEAIEAGDDDLLREELGDLLFLLLFVARIAEEEGRFSIEDVLERTHAKMKERHPHVFGTRRQMKPGEILDQWERIKKTEKAEDESVLSGIPKGLPALIKAQRIQQRAASLGFDWDQVQSVFEKLREEMAEFEEAWRHRDDRKGSLETDRDRIKDEMGDILFSLVNVSRFLGVRAEDALQSTIDKFKQRFAHVEKEIAQRGRMTLDEMDKIWERSKKHQE